QIAQKNLGPHHFWVPMCKTLYCTYLNAAKEGRSSDLLSLFIDIHSEEAPPFLEEILQKKINPERAEFQFRETVQKLLDRDWLQKREEIKRLIHSGNRSEEEVLNLAKQFDELKKNRPVILEDT